MIALVQRLAERVLGYRIFPDAEGKVNLSLLDVGGELLAVPQFTLAADTTKGTRPGFSGAAAPGEGRRYFEFFLEKASLMARTSSGRFGADMKVRLVNDGPVTFWLRASPPRGS